MWNVQLEVDGQSIPISSQLELDNISTTWMAKGIRLEPISDPTSYNIQRVKQIFYQMVSTQEQHGLKISNSVTTELLANIFQNLYM